MLDRKGGLGHLGAQAQKRLRSDAWVQHFGSGFRSLRQGPWSGLPVSAKHRKVILSETKDQHRSEMEADMLQKTAVKSVSRRVAIVVQAPEAQDVRVTGDFTQWTAQGIRLSHDGKGEWRTVLPLEPGEYQYRLLVDGKWQDHAAAAGRVANPFGSENCVLKVL